MLAHMSARTPMSLMPQWITLIHGRRYSLLTHQGR
jgi:hypothetical protein